MKKSICLLSIAILFLSSCTNFIQCEKRHYRKGFYVHHSNRDQHLISGDSIAKPVVVSHSTSVNNAIIADHVNPVLEKVVIREKEKLVSIKRSATQIAQRVKSNSSGHGLKISKNPVENDNSDHDRKTAKVLGVFAIILIAIGLILLEGAASFAIVPLAIGVLCALLGLKFGRSALNVGSKKKKGITTNDADKIASRKKAKNAYLLNVVAIMLLLAYILIRYGVLIFGSGPIGIAAFLCVLCLLLFLIFRMGLFKDLKD